MATTRPIPLGPPPAATGPETAPLKLACEEAASPARASPHPGSEPGRGGERSEPGDWLSDDLEHFGTDSGLSRPQLLALQAILSGRTRTEAARLAGVGRTTLFRWLADPKFVVALGQLQEEFYLSIRAELRSLAGEAVGALRQLLIDPSVPAAVKLAAVREVLGGFQPTGLPTTPEAVTWLLRQHEMAKHVPKPMVPLG